MQTTVGIKSQASAQKQVAARKLSARSKPTSTVTMATKNVKTTISRSQIEPASGDLAELLQRVAPNEGLNFIK